MSREALDTVLESLKDLRISRRRLKMSTLLGSGGFGDVYLADLKSSLWPGAVGTTVAVKQIRTSGNDEERARTAMAFARELRVWAGLHSPYVLPLSGFYLDKQLSVAYLISPYMKNGNVKDFLLRTSGDMLIRSRLIYEVAEGMKYLHSRKVVHGDLKAINILINDDSCAVICDFGVARIVNYSTGLTTSHPPPASLRYLAPEYLQSERPTHTMAGDIWAFGCVVLEVIVGAMPFSDVSAPPHLMASIARGQIPADLSTISLHEDFIDLMNCCWSHSALDRPSIYDCALRAEVTYVRLQVESPLLQAAEKGHLSHQLGSSLWNLYKTTRLPRHLAESVIRSRDALAGRPDGDEELRSIVQKASGLAAADYERTNSLEDLNAAVEYHQELLRLSPDESERESTRNGLATMTYTRYERCGRADDLDSAILHWNELLERQRTQPQSYPIIQSLALAYHTRCSNSGKDMDLDNIITNYTSFLNLCPQITDFDRAATLLGLAETLVRRYRGRKDVQHLRNAVQRYEEYYGLQSTSVATWHADYAWALGELGETLLLLHRITKVEAELDSAIECCFRLLRLLPDDFRTLNGSFKGVDDGSISALCSRHGATLNRLGRALLTRFEQGGNLEDLKTMIHFTKPLVQFPSPYLPETEQRAVTERLASALMMRFHRMQDPEDLELAVTHYRGLLEVYADDLPRRRDILSALGNALLTRSEYDLFALDEALTRLQSALDLTPDGHDNRHSILRHLGFAHLQRFESSGDPQDLDAVIRHYGEALESNQYDEDRHTSLINHGFALLQRFGCSGFPEDACRAVGSFESALELCPEGHEERSATLDYLLAALLSRTPYITSMGELNTTVKHFLTILPLRPNDHPDHATILLNLALVLYKRYEVLLHRADLDDSISRTREALVLISKDDPQRLTAFNHLGDALICRYDLTKDEEDVKAAGETYNAILDLPGLDSLQRVSALRGAGAVLVKRFDALGDPHDLSIAVTRLRDVLEVLPKYHAESFVVLLELSAIYERRYAAKGDDDDLAAVIRSYRDALPMMPVDHPKRSPTLNSLAAAEMRRYEARGTLEDLNGAVDHRQDLLEASSPDDVSKRDRLQQLAVALSKRYERVGSEDDLSALIKCYESILDLGPVAHPERHVTVYDLAEALFKRHQLSGKPPDIDASIRYYEDTVRLRPAPHPERDSILDRLAVALLRRYDQLGKASDLNSAVYHYQQALRLRPEGHPLRDLSLHHLGFALVKRHKRTTSLDDLDAAITCFQDALVLRPEGHLERGYTLHELGSAFQARYSRSGDVDALDKSIRHYLDAMSLHPKDSSQYESVVLSLETALDLRMKIANEVASDSRRNRRRSFDKDLHGRLQAVGYAIYSQYDITNSLDDLVKATEYHMIALKVADLEIERAHTHHHLGLVFCRRFDHGVDIKDLNSSIQHYQDALAIFRNFGRGQSTISSLSVALKRRFHLKGMREDLDESIACLHELLELLSKSPKKTRSPKVPKPPPKTSRFSRFTKKIKTLLDSSDEDDEDEDDDDNNDLDERDRDPKTDKDRCEAHLDLASAFIDRYDHFSNTEDLEMACANCLEARQFNPDWNNVPPIVVSYLIATLRRCYVRTRFDYLIEEAIDVTRQVLDCIPDTSPLRPRYLVHLGRCLCARCQKGGGKRQDVEEAMRLYQEAMRAADKDVEIVGLAPFVEELNSLQGMEFNNDMDEKDPPPLDEYAPDTKVEPLVDLEKGVEGMTLG